MLLHLEKERIVGVRQHPTIALPSPRISSCWIASFVAVTRLFGGFHTLVTSVAHDRIWFASPSSHSRCAMDRNVRAAEMAEGERNVGTLWLLRRGESTARCSLVSASEVLYVRVMLDGTLLRSEECDSYQQAFDLAKRWLIRMTDRGWTRFSSAAPRTA
jgi:hypothetical protein